MPEDSAAELILYMLKTVTHPRGCVMSGQKLVCIRMNKSLEGRQGADFEIQP